MPRRYEAVQITLPPADVERVRAIAEARRVPAAIVYREAVAAYLLALAQEPGPVATAHDLRAAHNANPNARHTAPTRGRASARFGHNAVTPRVVPGGRRTT